MTHAYDIAFYDGSFYRFTDERGSPHTVAGEYEFNNINKQTSFRLIVPLYNKYGFTMASYGKINGDSWQVFDTKEERNRKADEYFIKICLPLNAARDERRKKLLEDEERASKEEFKIFHKKG